MLGDPLRRKLTRKPLATQQAHGGKSDKAGEGADRLRCLLQDTSKVACRPDVLPRLRDYNLGGRWRGDGTGRAGRHGSPPLAAPRAFGG